MGLNHHHLWPGRGSRQGKIPGSVSPSKVLLVLPRRHVRWMVAHRTNQSVFPREALQRQRQLHQVKGGVVTGTESSRRWFCGSQLLSSPVLALRFFNLIDFSIQISQVAFIRAQGAIRRGKLSGNLPGSLPHGVTVLLSAARPLTVRALSHCLCGCSHTARPPIF